MRMIDAYFHLDGSAADPLEDLEQRLASAKVRRVLVVETWAGTERTALDELVACPGIGAEDRSVAFCFRGQNESELSALLDRPAVRAIRARTGQLEPTPCWLAALERSERMLLCHGEAGIGRLTRAIGPIAARHPRLRIYVPHLGWPRQDKKDDPEWADSIAALAALPNVMLGISALAHFSRTAYPHEDLRPLAQTAMDRLGPGRLVAATDYPLIEKPRYAESYHLARKWITERWPKWNDNHAL